MESKEHILDLHLAKPPEQGFRRCAWPDCECDGDFRAPRSRYQLRSYHWFCLAHVRRYNTTWNYYTGMSDAEVEADIRRDTVWDRPTWPMGAVKDDFDHVSDVFGLFEGAGRESSRRHSPTRHRGSPEAQAMDVLGLRPPLTVCHVKARYKELVKRHHPDANGGDKTSEEKFKQISHAYETLMDALDP